MKPVIAATISLFALGALALPAQAQDLVYEPINPSFGGNPFNSNHLLAIANAQNDYERPAVEATSQDDLDRFIRSLQSRLLSSLSTQVANAIFGEDAQDSGVIQFGGQTVSFVRTLDGIQLTITDEDGTTTVITVPVLQTEDDGLEEDDVDADASSKLVRAASPDDPFGASALFPATPLNAGPSSGLSPITQPIR